MTTRRQLSEIRALNPTPDEPPKIRHYGKAIAPNVAKPLRTSVPTRYTVATNAPSVPSVARKQTRLIPFSRLARIVFRPLICRRNTIKQRLAESRQLKQIAD